jgi:hypothetical protein
MKVTCQHAAVLSDLLARRGVEELNIEPFDSFDCMPLYDLLAKLLAQTYRGVYQASRPPSRDSLRVASLTTLHVTAAPPLDVREGAECHGIPHS